MDDYQTKKNHNPIDFNEAEEPGRQSGPAMNEAGGDSGATRQDDWCDGDMLYAGAPHEDGDAAGHGWENEFPCGDLANLPFKAGDELT
ncbi:MAG: hypothetical protein ISN26_05255, partial [Betaproteobacteria bacterium AqS2]|nr:hypothetical protein [Betaproteobacteria bacterium AqS2]